MTEPWYQAFFRGEWQRWYAELLPQVDATAQARFIAKALELAPGSRVLDTVCGHGRHAIALARDGYRVTGADLSEIEIERARTAAQEAGVEVDLMVCDMRELPFEAEFDAAYNVSTSFGFFEDPEDDRRALRAFRRALRPGGRFFFDYFNFVGIARVFQRTSWTRAADGSLHLEEHRMDLLGGAQRDVWTIQPPDGEPRSYELFIRLYAPYEMRRELERAGFRVTKAYGGWDGSDLGVASTRLMLVAEAV